MEDMISRKAAIDLFPNDDLEWDTKGGYIAPHLARQMISELPLAQPDKDMIHLQKEQAYMQGWEEGRKALREEIWENERDRLD